MGSQLRSARTCHNCSSTGPELKTLMVLSVLPWKIKGRQADELKTRQASLETKQSSVARAQAKACRTSALVLWQHRVREGLEIGRCHEQNSSMMFNDSKMFC